MVTEEKKKKGCFIKVLLGLAVLFFLSIVIGVISSLFISEETKLLLEKKHIEKAEIKQAKKDSLAIIEREKAASAGFYEAPDGTKYPKLQILTIQELFEGKTVDYPRYRIDATHKSAERKSKQDLGEQARIL